MFKCSDNVRMAEKASLAKRKTICWILATIFCFILTFYCVRLYNRTKSISFAEIPIDQNAKNKVVKYSQFRLKTMDKNWTLLVTVNDGYFDFLQNWIHFYRKLNLNYPLIIIAEDDIVFFKLQQLGGNLITLVKSQRNVSSEAVVYGSQAFSRLASGRPTYILKYLQNGVNIVYADLDAVWLRNPFPYFNGNFKVWMQSDGPGILCTGLIAVKSSKETIELMQEWEDSLNKRLQIDQGAFNQVVKYSKIPLKTLDTNRFPSGKLYFQEFNDKQRSNVVIVHNNYIKGHQTKLQRFKTYKLWFPE